MNNIVLHDHGRKLRKYYNIEQSLLYLYEVKTRKYGICDYFCTICVQFGSICVHRCIGIYTCDILPNKIVAVRINSHYFII